ncbi:hypothetical protein WJX73_007914 [Symbiochloris irregularis]|uniref:Secreted protein n=1 Tax=Symbiochloris irregularis TaxID=706552 RepID=A0AAW1PYD1_9CHLO
MTVRLLCCGLPPHAVAQTSVQHLTATGNKSPQLVRLLWACCIVSGTGTVNRPAEACISPPEIMRDD